VRMMTAVVPPSSAVWPVTRIPGTPPAWPRGARGVGSPVTMTAGSLSLGSCRPSRDMPLVEDGGDVPGGHAMN
jgi:hypothetical protein